MALTAKQKAFRAPRAKKHKLSDFMDTSKLANMPSEPTTIGPATVPSPGTLQALTPQNVPAVAKRGNALALPGGAKLPVVANAGGIPVFSSPSSSVATQGSASGGGKLQAQPNYTFNPNSPNTFSQAQEALNKLTEDFQSKADQANAANEARFDEIKSGRQQMIGDALALLAGVGDQQRQDINRQFDDFGANQQANLVKRGLAASTITPAVQANVERERAGAQNRLASLLAREQLSVQNQLGNDLFNFIERKNETGPDFGALAALAQQAGASGAFGSPFDPTFDPTAPATGISAEVAGQAGAQEIPLMITGTNKVSRPSLGGIDVGGGTGQTVTKFHKPNPNHPLFKFQ